MVNPALQPRGEQSLQKGMLRLEAVRPSRVVRDDGNHVAWHMIILSHSAISWVDFESDEGGWQAAVPVPSVERRTTLSRFGVSLPVCAGWMAIARSAAVGQHPPRAADAR